jgi:uncharacterized membrane protein YfcA
MDKSLLIGGVGFLAQLVDGALGMAYGTVSAAVLLALGIPRPIPAPPSTRHRFLHARLQAPRISASQCSVAAILAAGHSRRCRRGARGNVGGPSRSGSNKALGFGYLGCLGLFILYRVIRPHPRTKPLAADAVAIPTGFIGAMADSIGGGGWGPIATSTLVGRGHAPRLCVGSVNLAEFIVKTASAATFLVALGLTHIDVVIPLVLGGIIAAPFSGYLARVIPARVLMLLIGLLILLLSAWQIFRLFL